MARFGSVAFRTVVLRCMLLAATWFAVAAPARAQLEFEREPINYATAAVHDPVARLQERLDGGEVTLAYDDRHGYLASVLEQLNISPSSQVLVFSKTSFQARRISPSRPRAVYFNDDTYIGWVQGGEVVEVLTTDALQGSIFYALSQEPSERPQFVRDRGQCLTCHASARTRGVPGPLVRSMFVDPRGQPRFGSGSFTTDHTSPFDERWGGWYVTGTHGPMRHMGNVFAERGVDDVDHEAGANVTDLSDRFSLQPYLTPHSDLVALMVLEHQTQMHNHLTRANYESRSAEHYDGIMNKALKRPADYRSDSTVRRIETVGEKLVQYLLFADEFALQAPVQGTSAFAQEFQTRGPRDSQGRSLRELDLQKRLFRFPCSYMIYSPSFESLPQPVKQYVARRLREVLTGKDHSDAFAHLSRADRTAVWEILRDTKPDLWKE